MCPQVGAFWDHWPFLMCGDDMLCMVQFPIPLESHKNSAAVALMFKKSCSHQAGTVVPVSGMELELGREVILTILTILIQYKIQFSCISIGLSSSVIVCQSK